MMKSMMQDAAQAQADQLRNSMDLLDSRMQELTSKTRFAAPEADAQRLES
jgi:hypothetical protein